MRTNTNKLLKHFLSVVDGLRSAKGIDLYRASRYTRSRVLKQQRAADAECRDIAKTRNRKFGQIASEMRGM